MFGKLFGKKKPKEDPKKAAEMEAKKDKFELAKTKDDLDKKMEENRMRIETLETQIQAKTKEAITAKKANQKDKAMRLLTEIKQMKAKITKLSGYNTMMMKQMGNLENVGIDSDMTEIFAGTVN